MPRGRALASGIRTDYETPFGPSQVTMQPADVGVVTEGYTAALNAASRMPANPGLPLAACCRHVADRACAHVNLDQDEQALALLQTPDGHRAAPPSSRRSGGPRPAVQ